MSGMGDKRQMGAQGDCTGDEPDAKRSKRDSSSHEVAKHYNAVPEKGIVERMDSRIFYLRNFNNWIKSMLISEFLDKISEDGYHHATVLDLCCGKGGDLLKWKVGKVRHLVATDIATISLDQCQKRYREMVTRERQRIFTAEFIIADATKDRLIEHYSDENMQFDLCSCQFSMHYSFESERQARIFLKNATESIRPGGYLIGTLPDAERIMHCIKNGKSAVYVNDVLRLEYGDADVIENDQYVPPIFGAKFHFHLHEQVNCPEYLIHFPVLERLLSDCDMELVYMKRFPDAFNYFASRTHDKDLILRMKAIEKFPPLHGQKLVGKEESYKHASAEQKRISLENNEDNVTVGTLSKDEWEVASMYIVFAFEKRRVAGEKYF